MAGPPPPGGVTNGRAPQDPATAATTGTTAAHSPTNTKLPPPPSPKDIPRPDAIQRKSTASSIENMFGIDLQFDALYTLTQRLRSGSFATVYVCKHNLSGEEFAVKVIDRTKLKPKDDAAVYREVSILRTLGGYPGVINLIDFFELPNKFDVILELARGGDVFDRLSRRTVYTEKDARDLAQRMLESVKYVHYCGIVHRDLKPENLLLMDEVNDCNVKLADFGFAKKLEGSKGLQTRCGTPAFVAPEILVGAPYDYKVDMWSVGVILYLLLGGYPPFQHENHKGLFRKIRAADYVFHEKYWDEASVEAKQLIAQLLTVDPAHRIDATAALKSRWMQIKDDELSERSLTSSLRELKKFNARRKLRGAMHAVTWAVTATFWNADTVSFGHSAHHVNTTVSAFGMQIPVGGGGSGTSGTSGVTTATGSSNVTHKIANGKVGKTFHDLYELKVKLRSGSYSTVWEGYNKVDESSMMMKRTPYAIKVVQRNKLQPKDDAAVLNEVAILQSLQYKHIVALVDFFEEKEYFFLVMELMDGGDVFDRIVQRNHYTEKDARDLARVLLKAVEFMHRHGVAHRDLKPQNLLLQSKDDDSTIKVADFGFAKRVHTPQSLMTRCGTPTYVAPEILKNHPHDQSADMWSVGVIIYVLLVGYPPFMEENQRTLFRKIRLGQYEFYDEDWMGISTEAKELIEKLLVVDPTHRMTAGEALRNEWILGDDDTLSSRDLSGSLSELRKSIMLVQEVEGGGGGGDQAGATTGATNKEVTKAGPKWLTCGCGVLV